MLANVSSFILRQETAVMVIGGGRIGDIDSDGDDEFLSRDRIEENIR